MDDRFRRGLRGNGLRRQPDSGRAWRWWVVADGVGRSGRGGVDVSVAAGTLLALGVGSGVGSASTVGSAAGRRLTAGRRLGRGRSAVGSVGRRWARLGLAAAASDLADRGALVAGQGVAGHQFQPVSATRPDQTRPGAGGTLFQEIRRAGVEGTDRPAARTAQPRRTVRYDGIGYADGVGTTHPGAGSLVDASARPNHGFDPVSSVLQRGGVQRSGHGGHDAGHGGADHGARPRSAGSRARPRSSRPVRRPAPCSATGRGRPWARLGSGVGSRGGGGLQAAVGCSCPQIGLLRRGDRLGDLVQSP